MLDGQAGSGGETVQVGLTRSPAVHPNRLWKWVYRVYERENVVMRRKRRSVLEDEYRFGTGRKEQEELVVWEMTSMASRPALVGAEVEVETGWVEFSTLTQRAVPSLRLILMAVVLYIFRMEFHFVTSSSVLDRMIKLLYTCA